MRRQADLQPTQTDQTRHEQALQETGNACDYYQALRNRAAIWVGALRELKSKVDPILETLTQLILSNYTMAQQEWVYHQDDAISILRQAGVLDQVMGRQPPLPPPLNDIMAVTVDEFGRDVQSQFRRDRDKRYRSRMLMLQPAARATNTDNKYMYKYKYKYTHNNNAAQVEAEDDSDHLLWNKTKEKEATERYNILQEALRVAIDDLDMEYTSMNNLVQLFKDWKGSYPEEYRQCYANLSLGDLAAILVEAEFCRSSRLLLLLSPSSAKATTTSTTSTTRTGDGIMVTLIQQIQKMDNNNNGGQTEEENEGAVHRVVERNHLSFLLKLLKEAPSACFISSSRCRLLSTLLQEILPDLNKETKAYENIQDVVLTSIQQALDTIAIPILLKKDPDATDATNDVAVREGLDNGQLEHAIRFANNEQVLWVQHLLLNIMMYWIPHLQSLSKYDDIVKCLLDFASSKFLFLLSSMDSTDAASSFAPIWEIISKDHAHLLESPAFIIQSAPIRAAAMAYGLSQNPPS
jgi:hypothetical protein